MFHIWIIRWKMEKWIRASPMPCRKMDSLSVCGCVRGATCRRILFPARVGRYRPNVHPASGSGPAHFVCSVLFLWFPSEFPIRFFSSSFFIFFFFYCYFSLFSFSMNFFKYGNNFKIHELLEQLLNTFFFEIWEHLSKSWTFFIIR